MGEVQKVNTDDRHVKQQQATAALDLLRRHFHAASETTLRDFAKLMETRLPIAGSTIDALEHDLRLAEVERVRKLAKDLWRTYLALPVGSKSPDKLQARLRDVVYDLTGEPPLLSDKLTGPDGQPCYPSQKGALDAVRDQISESPPLHHKQRDADFNSKVALVEFARDVWECLIKTRPPLDANPGNPYFEFMADLIEHFGKPWGAKNTLRAWRTYFEGQEYMDSPRKRWLSGHD